MTTATGRDAAEIAEAYDEERPARRLSGRVKTGVAIVAGAVSVYALYAVFQPVATLQYRMTFLAVVLPLVFLVYRPFLKRTKPTLPPAGDGAAEGGPGGAGPVEAAEPAEPTGNGGTATATDITTEAPPEAPATPAPAPAGPADRPNLIDWVLAALSFACLIYPVLDFEAFVQRAVEPSTLDIAAGVTLTVLLLEATRRTVGWILPVICLVFLGYAYYGGLLPLDWPIGHKGFDLDRIISQLYMGTEGYFGVPMDVAATYIVLFTIYGAVLEYSGASKFFLDISFAAFRRSRTAPGRTVTMAGFLLGTVSGSGVATTVSLGTVAWPMLRRAGYPPVQGGGVLAAAGIGAILSPPTMGAAAFIIAEYLEVSYLQVLIYAIIPTLLYYLGILLSIEIDARRFGTSSVQVDAPPFGRLLLRFGYHFSSLFLIVLLMAIGRSPFQAVAFATAAAFLLSFLDKNHRMGPKRVGQALAAGTLGVLPVTAVCALAGIVVGTITLADTGRQFNALVVDAAAGNLALAALYAALAVLVLGLAVPVTASFIIAAVIIGPALTTLGVHPAEAYMFIFYYAVLSEVSPPTALSSVAAAAITGGHTFKTMMMTWRYTLPAFLVPFAFVLTPGGSALLAQGSIGEILLVTAVSAVAVAALAVATGAWLLGPAGVPERLLAAAAAVALLFLTPVPIMIGLAALAVAVVINLLRKRAQS